MENAPQVIEAEYKVVNFEDFAMTADKIQRQVSLIQDVMQRVMKEDQHYGTIPGCGPKPTLLKPGAEKLSTTFRLAPSYDIRRIDMMGDHREYEILCTLTHIPSAQIIGQGVGSCSTMEGKYRFRKAEQKCPECGKETIIKGKQEYGGGWLCWAKKGGCGAKFQDGNPDIENQDMGRVEHDNPPDYYNTVLKMAKKRAHVDAVLTATAASDIFTQDVEDMPPEILGKSKPKESKPKESKPKTAKSKSESPTKKQYAAIFAKGKVGGLSSDETKELADWFKKGESMTSKEASHIIDNFIQVTENYMNSPEYAAKHTQEGKSTSDPFDDE